MTAHDDEMLAAWLLERFGEDGEQAGLLDEDLVVGYVEDRLSPEEREAVEARLARDPEARAMLGLASSVEDPVRQVPAKRSAPRRAWGELAVVAAILLLGIGAILWSGGEDPTPPAPDATERLLAVADRLAEGAPDVFGDLRAAIESPTPIARPSVERGGITILLPRGTVISDQPTLRWKAVPGADSYRVQVSSETGTSVFETTTRETELEVGEPIEPGAYVVEVSAESSFGAARGSASFRRATPREQGKYDGAEFAIDIAVAPGDKSLLLAYFALSEGLYVEARRALERHRRDNPKDPRLARIEALLAPRDG